MSKIRRIIPFSFWPANWGMTGTRRAKAEAEYYWDGIDLDRKLVEIEHEEDTPEFKLAMAKVERKYHMISEEEYTKCTILYSPNMDDTTRARELAKHRHRFGHLTAEELEYELLNVTHINKDSEEYRRSKLRLDHHFRKITDEQFDRENLSITYPDSTSEEAIKAFLRHDLKYRKITELEYDRRFLELEFKDHDTLEFKLKLLDLDKKHGLINENEWEKQTATLNGEPWFNIIGADQRRGGDGSQLAIELDWNEYFPRFLESKGWSGHTDDEIVDRWFEEAMRQMVDPGLDEDQLEAMEDEDYLPSRGAQRQRGADGRTEYS